VLYEDGNKDSFQVCIAGYIRDVTTQLRRGLDGFWVAHPDFVRLGIALVEAWRRWDADPADTSLAALIDALIDDEGERAALHHFVFVRKDVVGLSADDPRYQRGVLAADIETSDVIANDDPEEVRYNIFQAVQYLADWLSGNGCVALPARMSKVNGESVFVRIMDDLATTERSRWELWAEVAHGRVSLETFESILADEMAFIRAGVETKERRIQVRCEGEAARWYPTAERLLRQLVTSPDPVEFATELLMPFTMDVVRLSGDPWETVCRLCPGKYQG
jgi:malate synthase